jgi:hypothetical protein
MMRASVARVLVALAIVAILWSVVIALSGGGTIVLAGIKVTSTNAWRPLIAGLAAAALAVLVGGITRMRDDWRRLLGRLTPAHGALALAVATMAVSLGGNSWTASGADSFAYVSQAALWRAGRIDAPVPLAADVPWPNAVATFSPFGYRPAPDGAPSLVPVTTPGLPLLMAALQTIAGHCAAFVVTPVSGGALVILTFAIGTRVRSAAAGLIAAWLVATSPALLFMLMWPMTDVPAAACTALLIWLLLGRSSASAIAAGLTTGAGLLLRPNFFLIAAAAGLWLVLDGFLWSDGRARWRRALLFVIGVLPGALVMAWLNARWYGSPIASGYGTAGNLFAVSRLVTNVGRYGRWLVGTSPLAIVGVAAIIVALGLPWTAPWGRRTAWLFALVAASACSLYLLYEPYTAWWYLRFLLPAWPVVFVAASIAIDSARRRSRPAAAIVVAITLAAGVFGVWFARSHGVFAIGETERRYVSVARLVDTATEPTAVILTSEHSGTLRYYTGRVTLRFDVLDPAWLDRAIAWLVARGRHPYILLEDWEAPIFEARFRGASPLGDLAFPPIVAWQSARIPGWVWLYDPLRQDAATASPSPDFERTQPRCAPPAAEPWPR